MGHEQALQKAVFAILSGLTGLTVRDYPLQVADPADASAGYPYVNVGDLTNTAWNTDTENGGNLTIIVHAWSRHRGNKELQEISKRVYDALHRQEQALNTALEAYVAIGIEFDSGETLNDPDGVTRHGIQRFRVYLDQTE